MQCRFMPSHGGTTVVIFILSQPQLLLTSNKSFYIAFINIEKDSSRYMSVVCMLLNQRVVGVTDALHDQGHEKQSNSWQL